MRIRNAQASAGSPLTVAERHRRRMARLPLRLLQPVEPVGGAMNPSTSAWKAGSRSSRRLKWNWRAIA